MLTYAISLTSFAAMILVMNMNSVYDVGDEVSNLFSYKYCDFLSVQHLPLMSPLRFSKKHEVHEGG